MYGRRTERSVGREKGSVRRTCLDAPKGNWEPWEPVGRICNMVGIGSD